MNIPVTTIYVVIFSCMLVVLAYRTAMLRRKNKIGVGDGNKPVLQRAIGAHGNAAEHLPIALILMLTLEINGTSSLILHSLGIVLLLSRVIHLFGLSKHSGKSFGRVYGILGTWLVILTMAGLNLRYIF